MHPESMRLSEAFIRQFGASDREVTWLDIEKEHELWLTPDIVLLGKIDATGLTADGEPFFADWKTASKNKARNMVTEKSKWRMTPQALTYGVLLGRNFKRFSVRWALKTTPATCDFEWYSYSQPELDMWRQELINIAKQIRAQRNSGATHYPLNLTNCTKWGEAYACPFRDSGCWQLDFNHVPAQMSPRTQSHLGIEDRIKAANTNPDLVILGASRVNEYLECNEKYRRIWEEGLTEDSEALTIGTDFHTIIAEHLSSIKEQQDNGRASKQ